MDLVFANKVLDQVRDNTDKWEMLPNTEYYDRYVWGPIRCGDITVKSERGIYVCSKLIITIANKTHELNGYSPYDIHCFYELVEAFINKNTNIDLSKYINNKRPQGEYYCKNCIHMQKRWLQKPNSWRCTASPVGENHRNPLTGELESKAIYDYCSTINPDGNCVKYQQKEICQG